VTCGFEKHCDPRKKFVLEKADPRIHFALVCGSHSCPPIDIYEERKIDEELDLVSAAFINSDEVTIEKEKMIIALTPNIYLSGDRVFLGTTWRVGDIGVKRNAPSPESNHHFSE
jgi:hypothetical protein